MSRCGWRHGTPIRLHGLGTHCEASVYGLLSVASVLAVMEPEPLVEDMALYPQGDQSNIIN